MSFLCSRQQSITLAITSQGLLDMLKYIMEDVCVGIYICVCVFACCDKLEPWGVHVFQYKLRVEDEENLFLSPMFAKAFDADLRGKRLVIFIYFGGKGHDSSARFDRRGVNRQLLSTVNRDFRSERRKIYSLRHDWKKMKCYFFSKLSSFHSNYFKEISLLQLSSKNLVIFFMFFEY